MLSYTFAMRSSVGRVRSGNEDVCMASLDDGVFIVCDGMGGAAAGEVASQLAATTFLNSLKNDLPSTINVEETLRAAIESANTAVLTKAARSSKTHGMGTTLVAALVLPRHIWVAHIGDSRCYRMRDGQLLQLTRDHSLVQDQILAGQLTPQQAEQSPLRNVLTRAIGSSESPQPEIQRLDPQPGDRYLLASDGLTRELSHSDLAARLGQHGKSPEALCDELIEAANEAGGNDNVTALLLQIEA